MSASSTKSPKVAIDDTVTISDHLALFYSICKGFIEFQSIQLRVKEAPPGEVRYVFDWKGMTLHKKEVDI